jgi:hypothetical protein
VPRAAGPNNILYVRLEKECPVAKTEEVGPLQNRLLVLDPDCRIEAVRKPLGAPQVTAKLSVDDSKARYVPRPGCPDAAGYNASGKEKRQLALAVVWCGLDARGYAQPTQNILPRLAKPDQPLIEQAVEAVVAMFDTRRDSQFGGGRPKHFGSEIGNALPSYQTPAL